MGNMVRNQGQSGRVIITLGLGASLITVTAQAQGWKLATNLTVKADLTVKESFDSNVFLQDVEPSPSVTNAAQPFRIILLSGLCFPIRRSTICCSVGTSPPWS